MDRFPSEINGYTPICLCGRGAYGQVWLVMDVVGNFRALKIVPKSTLGGDWEREFRGLHNYQTKVRPHPNLIQVFHIEDCGGFSITPWNRPTTWAMRIIIFREPWRAGFASGVS